MRRVHCQQDYDRPPDELWQILRRFGAPWHPLVDRMERHGPIRRFWVDGAPYVERLTYFSDSDRVLRYSHVSGIEGAQRYDAQVYVAGNTVHWKAEIEAAPARAEDIAAGTRLVFKQGLAALARLPAKPDAPYAQHGAPAARPRLKTHMVLGAPPIAVTTCEGVSDTLVLFLHGIGGNRSNWRLQLETLAPYARVAAIDLRGYGDSALGPTQTTIQDHCNDIDRVMRALCAKRLILVGLSFGAWIATSYALRRPLAGLVVSGGCTGMSEASEDVRQAFRAGRLAPLDAGQTPADMAPDVLEVIAGPYIPEAARAALCASMQAIPATTYRDAVTCFTSPPERFDFARLTCPVLVMTGEHDRLAPPAELRGVAQRIWQKAAPPDVRFEVIPRAAHVCNLEAPAAYNAPLLEFVQGITG
jgi:pimeloyl-ACP methyl ester carboxylesterase